MTHVQYTIFCKETFGHGCEHFWHQPGPLGERRDEHPHASLQGPRQKNEIHRRGKSMKQKLLEMIQATKWNLKNAEGRAKKTCILFTLLEKLLKSRFLGHNCFICQISSKLNVGTVSCTISINFCFITFLTNLIFLVLVSEERHEIIRLNVHLMVQGDNIPAERHGVVDLNVHLEVQGDVWGFAQSIPHKKLYTKHV